jgi:hypothetical protein
VASTTTRGFIGRRLVYSRSTLWWSQSVSQSCDIVVEFFYVSGYNTPLRERQNRLENRQTDTQTDRQTVPKREK